MAFTDWATEKARLEDAIAAGDWTVASIGDAGQSIAFRSLDELRKHYQWVCSMAAAEAGTGYTRTCAGQGGTGRW